MTSIALRVRRWSRRRRDTIHCAAALLALTALLCLQSALVWHALAGTQIVMAQSSKAPPPHRGATPGLQPAHGPIRAGHDHAPAPIPHATTAKPPTRISGTALAVAIILVMTAIALLTARAVLPRLRRQTISPPTGLSNAKEATRSTNLHTKEIEETEYAKEAADAESGDNVGPRPMDAEEPTGPKQGDDPGSAVSPEDVGVAAVGGRSRPVDTELDGQLPQPTPAPQGWGADTLLEEPSDNTPSAVTGDRHATRTGSVILYDRRLLQRVVFESQARLQWEGHDVACLTQDINMRGVRLRLPDDLPALTPPTMGTYAQVTLMLDGVLAVFKVRVGWRRSEDTGPVLGLHFLGVQKRHEELLQPIVMRGKPV